MKKIISIIMSLCVLFSLTACTSSKNENGQSDISSARELLETVWGSYGENELFSVLGGDITSENVLNNAPDTFPLDDAVLLESTFGLPSDQVANVDDAASMIHMMNANTFTCVAFHLTDSTNINTLTSALKDSLMNRQWLCGFPDTLLIMSVDDYVVSVFGADDIVQTFKEKLTTSYAAAEVVAEEALAF